ncbi:MAG: glycosyltransferase family 1 protein [Anaerolineaceae bacterium]|nr:glycosyltransferase family 1 protein [Anaerolineaceae bacterium]
MELTRTSFKKYFEKAGTRAQPILNGFSRHLVLRPSDWGAHIHITGYWFSEESAWQPTEVLEKFLSNGPAPVFIGFGSMPVKHSKQVLQNVVEALKQSGQRGIIQQGWGGLGAGEVLLDRNLLKVGYVPHEWLFPQMRMLMHHGGSGTTAAGLRAGVPACIVPFVYDQFFWGECLSALGVGPAAIPFKKLTSERLVNTIRMGTENVEMRTKASELGALIREEKGVEQAVEIIEEFMIL